MARQNYCHLAAWC